jgi:hypothetical protein
MVSEVIQPARMNTLHNEEWIRYKMSSVVHITDVINWFARAGSVNKGKSTGKLPESEETGGLKE